MTCIPTPGEYVDDRLAIQELQQQNDLLLGIMDSVNAFVYLFNRHTWTVEFLNRSWESKLHLNRFSMLNSPIEHLIDFTHPAAQPFVAFVERTDHEQNDHDIFSLPIRTPDGLVILESSQTVINGHVFGSAIQNRQLSTVVQRVENMVNRTLTLIDPYSQVDTYGQ